MAEAHNAAQVVEAAIYSPLRKRLAETDDFLTIKVNKTVAVRVCRRKLLAFFSKKVESNFELRFGFRQFTI